MTINQSINQSVSQSIDFRVLPGLKFTSLCASFQEFEISDVVVKTGEIIYFFCFLSTQTRQRLDKHACGSSVSASLVPVLLQHLPPDVGFPPVKKSEDPACFVMSEFL